MKNSLLDTYHSDKGIWLNPSAQVARPPRAARNGKRLGLLVLAMVLPILHVAAQTVSDTPEMADTLRGNGKIYVVVAVVAVVLAGLLAFLVSLDRKVSRLEREMKE